MYDVCIVGAGPAGATLARLLAPRYRVLLADRRRLDLPASVATSGKPCGGLLAPAAQRELARQGLALPAGVTAGPQVFAVRARDLPSGLERDYQRFYVNVDREAFDRWLASLVPEAETAFGWRLAALASEPDCVALRFETPGGGRAGVRARLVVGADGASSLVRRLVFGRGTLPARYAAVQGFFRATAEDARFGALFDRRLTDFYCWTIPKGDTVLAGGAFPLSAARGRYEAFVEAARREGFGLGGELRRESALLLRPSRPRHVQLARGRVALVGEAAGLISPSSAEGISYALRSADALSRACEGGLDDVSYAYRLTAAALVMEVLGKAAKAHLIATDDVRRAVLRTGVGALAPDAPGWATAAELFGL